MRSNLTRKLVDAVSWDLDAMTDAQLRTVLRECKRMTVSNCDWRCYEGREMLANMAKAVLHTRKVKAKLHFEGR
jgi:hypothetical protein